jgi:Cdc6-like AAA superfamily ATPase
MADDIKKEFEKEKEIISTGVRKVYTPYRPIISIERLIGRRKEIGRLLGYMNSPGQHMLLYGSRGVGKTSVANVLAIGLEKMYDKKVIKKKCDSTDTFASIVAQPLTHVGVDGNLNTSQTHNTFSGGLEGGITLGIPIIKGQTNKGKTTVDTFNGFGEQANSPAWVAEKLKNTDALFIIDELDALVENSDRRKIAELIKHLSDANSPFKIMIVGIAETAEILIGGHSSVSRCLKETKLSRMTEEELSEIVTKGSKILGLNFEKQVIRDIEINSDGFPFMTHLLALKCAENAIIQDRNRITLEDLKPALEAAALDLEGTLNNNFSTAVRSSQRGKMYRLIVIAAAYCAEYGSEFTLQDLRDKIKQLSGNEDFQSDLSYYLNRLISDGKEKILQRVAKGVYRFSDPRMPSFVRMSEVKQGSDKKSS